MSATPIDEAIDMMLAYARGELPNTQSTRNEARLIAMELRKHDNRQRSVNEAPNEVARVTSGVTLVDLVNAHLDGSARTADTKALVDIVDRALRSSDNGSAVAQLVLRTMSVTEAVSGEEHWDALVKVLAEQHLVTVARLEAERRRHTETAALLARAEKRIEELSAELAAERVAKVAAHEQRDAVEKARKVFL